MRAPSRVLYDASGRPVQAGRGDLSFARPFDAAGGAGLGAVELTDADFGSTIDPTSRLGAGGFVYTNGQWSVNLTGGWGSGDPTGVWPYRIGVFKDSFGVPVQRVHDIPVVCWALQLTSSHSTTDEFTVGVLLTNGTGFTGATVDGRGIGITATGAGGADRYAGTELRSVNGTGSYTSGTPAAGAIGAQGGVRVLGTSGSQMLSFVHGYDASGVRVAGAASAASAGTVDFGSPTLSYLSVVAGRLSATATNSITVTFKLWQYPLFASPLPWT